MSKLKHVNNLWKDSEVKKLDEVEKLVYRSNRLGDDQRITNTGGGNTSSKVMMSDPLSGEQVEVLWVKGSGGDLRTSKKENFASLYMHKLHGLQSMYNRQSDKGPKTPLEDNMVDLYNHTVFNLNPRASSIDTPLHAFVPFKHVDHTHPNAVIAVAAARNGKKIMQEIYGDDIAWVPWQRPGFDLGLQLQDVCQKNPKLKGVILGQHGLINWANDQKECYLLSLELIEKAARYIEKEDKGSKTFSGQKVAPLKTEQQEHILAQVLPKLRGMVSKEHRFIATIQATREVLEFVNSKDAKRLAALGTSCPDHFLRTKIKPLFVEWNPHNEDVHNLIAKLEQGLENYRQDYAAYYQACKRPDSPAMRNPNPTVILIPGLGMIAWGKNKSESRVTAEFYTCAIEVMRGAEAMDKYIALPQQEAFDIEYWALEEAKLRRMPPEKEFERSVVVVVGAGSGIGKVTAHRVAKEGAHVVCADLSLESAQATAKELTNTYGLGIGVAGTGISNCGPAIGLAVDVTERESVRKMLEQVILAYGGFDHIIVTAGIFFAPDLNGNISDEKWAKTFDINVMGSYLVADEAKPIWKTQGLRGALVLTTSANAVVAKKGSVAYDTSKAAANHLIRELAIELSPLVRVNGLAPATVVAGSNMFPRDRVISSLAKYDIAYSKKETTESLRDKLANFYAQRTLTKVPILPDDQAEAALILISSKLSKTTGQVITVDGGQIEAFLR
jgi:rhamnulose-1-phosphate aldolase/alcohol dehydrogenase